MMEPLENRLVLSTFNLLPGAWDGDDTSLRAAITAANSNGEDDTIQLSAGTYSLTVAGANEDSNAAGDLDLTEVGHKLTIVGAGAGETTIDASALSDRIFHIASDVIVEIQDVTITGGSCEFGFGAGINNAGSIYMVLCYGDEDFLTGASGEDWFVAFDGDIITDKSANSGKGAKKK